MAEIQLPSDEEQEIILRRARDAKAFLNSSLFKEWHEWIEQETKILDAALATDTRNKFQQKLKRSEFLEQLCGVYSGMRASIGFFTQSVDKGDQLQKILDTKNEALEEKRKQDIKINELRRRAEGSNQKG